MKKTIITVLVTGVVVGGGLLYMKNHKAQNNNDYVVREVIEGNAKLGGCPREIRLGEWGCATIGPNCTRVEGNMTQAQLTQKCGLPSDYSVNLSSSQFDCAYNACMQSGLQVNPDNVSRDK